MITRKDVVQTVLQGKQALDSGNGDLGHLRFLINKMTYELSQGILAGNLEPCALTIGLLPAAACAAPVNSTYRIHNG